MLNPVDTGRRLMLRAAVYPLAAVVVASLVFLFFGVKNSAGLALSGVATVAGGWVAARTALAGGVQAAGSAMTRLLLAMVLKWVLVIVALFLGFGLWKLPAPGLLAGIAIAMIFQVLALTRR